MAATGTPDTPPPVAQLVHELPGRIRLRVPARRGDTRYFAEVSETFDLCRAVLVAETNPRTASVLIHHEGEPRTVWSFAHEQALFVPESPENVAPRVMDRAIADARQIDSWFRSSSGGDLDLGSVMTLGLVGLSALQLMRGNVLAPSVTLAWYAITLLQQRAAKRGPG